MEWLHDNMALSTVLVFGVGLWLWAFVILAPWFNFKRYLIHPFVFGLFLTMITGFLPSKDYSGDFIRTRMGVPHFLATMNKLEKSKSPEEGLQVHWLYAVGNLFFWTGFASMVIAIRTRRAARKLLKSPQTMPGR